MVGSRAFSADGRPDRVLMRVWWNWETRRLQVPVPAREWGFEALHAHQFAVGIAGCAHVAELVDAQP